VPIPQHMVVVAEQTVEFELHVPNWPRNHVCNTGCVPGIGVGSLDVEVLSYGTRGWI
jgi:hypothetical protein